MADLPGKSGEASGGLAEHADRAATRGNDGSFFLSPRAWALIAIGWVLIGLIDATRILFMQSAWDPGMNLVAALEWAMPDALLWIVLTPIPVFMGRRFPVRRPFVARDLAIHLVMAAVVGATHVFLDVLQNLAFDAAAGRPVDFWTQLGHIAPYNTHLMSGTYLLIVGIVRFMDDQTRLRYEREQTAHLQKSLAEARLRSLHARLRPHFLFNALHTGSALVSSDPEAARTLLRRLGDLLRQNLSTDERLVVPLAQEIDSVRTYLDIESLRFGDRLSVEIEVPDHLERASIPPFLLQPLVENALRHGLAPRRDGGRVTIRARNGAGALELTVDDDGVGMTADARDGIGLSTTRSRIAELYSGRASLLLEPLEPQGTRALIRIPLSTDEEVAGAGPDR